MILPEPEMLHPMTRKINVAYERISADREGRELGVTRQREDVEARAASLGCTITEHFTDNDRGASSRSRKPRPEFARMLALAESGQVGTIFAYSMSRLTRRPAEWEILIQLAERHGVKIRTCVSGDPDLTTADGRAVARTIAAWDAAEAERTAERIARKHRQRRDAGRPNWTWRPFGHNRDGTLHPIEAPAVRSAAADLRAGASLASICHRWNASPDLHPTGSRDRWDGPTLGNFMRNPRLAALMPDGKTRGAWEPVLTRDEWLATVRILDHRAAGRAQPARDGKARHLLSALAQCYRCDNRIIVARRGRQGHWCYTCRPGHVNVPVTLADDLVARYLAHGRKIGTLSGSTFAAAAPPDLQPLRAAALAAENVLAAIQEQVETAPDAATVSALLGPLTGAQRRLDAARTDLAAAEAAAAESATFAAVLARWEATDLSLKRAALRQSGLAFILMPASHPGDRLMIVPLDEARAAATTS